MIKKDYVNQKYFPKKKFKTKYAGHYTLKKIKIIILSTVAIILLLCLIGIKKKNITNKKSNIHYPKQNYYSKNIPYFSKKHWKYIKELENYKYQMRIL